MRVSLPHPYENRYNCSSDRKKLEYYEEHPNNVSQCKLKLGELEEIDLLLLNTGWCETISAKMG